MRNTAIVVAIFVSLGMGRAVRADHRPSGAGVAIVVDGKANAAIHVAAEVMAPDNEVARKSPASRDQEIQRARLRESVKDMVYCLEKMSGAQLQVATAAPVDNDRRIPILIGDLAVNAFGPPSKKSPRKQGWRMVVSKKGIGLMGESAEAASYAIYELLEQIGCRWYMPGDMGEVIHQKTTVALAECDVSDAPATLGRVLAGVDDVFKRRIRQGGMPLAFGHALEISHYVSKEQLQAHPEWCGLINGKRSPQRFCWANADLAAAVADGIIAQLDKQYVPTVSLSPDDGADFCECEQCKALDANDLDPTTGTISITDRFVQFCNRIAERVTKKYPDVLLGFLAYMQYTRPPVREKPHPNLVPVIAPMTYCRAHSMLQPDCPSRSLMRPIMEGWHRKARVLGYYNYMFHLAEVTAPYPMMKQMSDELPFLYANGVHFWLPETMSNFDSVLPGLVLANRMSWHTAAKPNEVLDEFFAGFYGAAAAPMRRYGEIFDDAWTKVPEHAGCGFGYGRRFTPSVMKATRTALDEAIAACKTDMERRRVKMQDDALKQFELFMKLRRDLFEGRLDGLAADSARWLEQQQRLGNEYESRSAFSKMPWAPETVGARYFKAFFDAAYQDGARIARDCVVIAPPLRQWRHQADKDKKGESLGWQKPDFDDANWKTTDPCLDTWFALGLDAYYGTVFYRARLKLPAVSAGKKTHLWISSTDGSAKVFVNGRHIPYVNEKGEPSNEFAGFCQPASFEITSAIKPSDEIQITIIGARAVLNELGAGGLMGPIYFYQEKPR
ncbi:MAG: DUF4838 domain-containing protein [Verrucomicrobia bacterium]|nr:DUF4838 domain-containing protein [Verrucomicrobiota bacterium]